MVATTQSKEKKRSATLTRVWLRMAIAPLVTVVVAGLFFQSFPQVTFSQLLWLAALGAVLIYVTVEAVTAEVTGLKVLRAEVAKDKGSLERQRSDFTREKEITRRAVLQRAIGAPVLAASIEEYHGLVDESVAGQLIRKARPAPKAASVVREQSERRRAAEAAARRARGIVEYYESLAPFLLDYKRELTEAEVVAEEQWQAEYTEDEREDHATRFLTKEEYRRLSTLDRNQLALDRYWTRKHSPSELGRMYERFVGYLYEQRGWAVEYHGIIKGLEDLGRDLVCRKGERVSVVQCKNWSHHRTVHEKHLFQLYGSVFYYRRDNPGANVHGAFYTSTTLSPVAMEAAAFLQIPVKQEMRLNKKYPCIKCNVSYRDRERIYHLPFDQQYDNVRIERDRGELYCATIAEAEAAGFRRAFRFRGTTSAS